MDDINKILSEAPNNGTIYKSILVTNQKINDPNYNVVMCSISGGSDSDVMMDLCAMLDKDKKVKYVYFDTGLEYQATKDHIKYLEDKYGVKIIKLKPKKPIPICCKEFGQPFCSKYASEMISRLQNHNFQWEDDTYENLSRKYPKCKSALRWWTNSYEKKTNGSESSFNIDYKKYLKEFIIQNPPTFKISNKCCKYAKKDLAHDYKKENKVDLSLVGVRKAEGGARSTAYKNCFTTKDGDEPDEYRAIFWYSDKDKKEYEEHYNVKHSKCYSEYGLQRTGCIGCPYGKDFEFELEVLKKYEPKLYVAANNIFGDAYEYTRKFNKFRKEMKNKELTNNNK